jgi:type II secretion system protein J
MRPVSGSRGFTLMETLLAVTLFSIVIVSSYGVFSMGIQIWKRSTGMAPVQRQSLFAFERMGEDIRSAILIKKPEPGIRIEKRAKDFNLEGNAESFLMPAVLAVESREGNSYQYGAAGWAWKSSSKQLCRMTQTASQLHQEKEPSCKVFLSGVQKLQFQYWIESPISKTFSWYDSWDPSEGLPQAVRVQMDVVLKNKRNPPVLKFERTFWVPAADKPMKTETGAA